MHGHAILGISLGSRSLGIAVMRNGKLLDWQVKSFAEAMAPQKLHMITGAVMRVVKEYDVGSVSIKLPVAFEMHTNLVALKRHLFKVLAAWSIPIHSYPLSDIKRALGDAVCNKEQLATCIATLYPELRFVYLKEQQARNPYYRKLFEAVAVLHIRITST